jgi:LysM repeat protein
MMQLAMNGEMIMRKKNKVFLLLAILLVGLLISGCERSATGNGANSGNNGDGELDQLDLIMTNVAANTPVGEVTPMGTNQGVLPGDGTQQAETPEPTATPLPPTPTPIPPTPQMVVPTTYTLHEGEWPYCIARRFNVDVDTLLSANNLARGAVYPAGLTLTIPQNAGNFKGERMLNTHPVVYTVQYDDTFYSIACRFGDVYPEEIAAANGMSVTDTLTAGTQLSIP